MSAPELEEPASVPIRMPASAWVVTVVAALVGSALTAWRLAGHAEVFACCYFVAVGVVLSAIDIAVIRLPDFLTLPSYPVLLSALAWAASAAGDTRSLYRSLEAAIILVVAFAVLCLTADAGLGDVKLAGLVGMLLGYRGWIDFFRGLLIGSLVAMAWVAARRSRGRRGGSIPLGPALVLGVVIVMVV